MKIYLILKYKQILFSKVIWSSTSKNHWTKHRLVCAHFDTYTLKVPDMIHNIIPPKFSHTHCITVAITFLYRPRYSQFEYEPVEFVKTWALTWLYWCRVVGAIASFPAPAKVQSYFSEFCGEIWCEYSKYTLGEINGNVAWK